MPVLEEMMCKASRIIKNKNTHSHSHQQTHVFQSDHSLNVYYFILFYFILFYFILFYFILFYFILFYFILFYFILHGSCPCFYLKF